MHSNSISHCIAYTRHLSRVTHTYTQLNAMFIMIETFLVVVFVDRFILNAFFYCFTFSNFVKVNFAQDEKSEQEEQRHKENNEYCKLNKIALRLRWESFFPIGFLSFFCTNVVFVPRTRNSICGKHLFWFWFLAKRKTLFPFQNLKPILQFLCTA